MDDSHNRYNDKMFDDLMRPLELNNHDKVLWNDKCDYYELENCNDLNPNHYNLVTLELNIRSLLAHEIDLKHLLQNLENRNTPVDIIMLCETFLNKKTENIIKLPGYNLISNCRKENKGGGVCIFLKECINYKIRHDLSKMEEKSLETIYVEITAKDGRKIIVGSLYRPSNVSTLPLQNHIINTMNIVRKEKGQKNVILGMDHNNDLLKAHVHTTTQEFLSSMMDSGLLPTITRPTRITKNSATLIDNIFVTEELHKNFDSLLIVDDMSDHFPVLALLKQKRLRDKDPLEFESRNLTDKKIIEIKQELQKIDWNGVLNSDNCDENFNTFHAAVQESMNKVAPIKKVKISGKRRFCEPWLTKGIEKSSHKKNKLYKETLKREASATTIEIYKNYRNAYNKLKRQAKIQYYRTRAEEYKSNTKKLWQLINSTISKNKHSGNIILSITVDGLQKSTPKAVANCFGEFYSNLGSSLANQITPSKINIETYIKRIQRNENSMFLNYTSKEEMKV